MIHVNRSSVVELSLKKNHSKVFVRTFMLLCSLRNPLRRTQKLLRVGRHSSHSELVDTLNCVENKITVLYININSYLSNLNLNN